MRHKHRCAGASYWLGRRRHTLLQRLWQARLQALEQLLADRAARMPEPRDAEEMQRRWLTMSARTRRGWRRRRDRRYLARSWREQLGGGERLSQWYRAPGDSRRPPDAKIDRERGAARHVRGEPARERRLQSVQARQHKCRQHKMLVDKNQEHGERCELEEQQRAANSWHISVGGGPRNTRASNAKLHARNARFIAPRSSFPYRGGPCTAEP